MVGKSHARTVINGELAVPDHVHQRNADEQGVGRPERFEGEHRPGHPLDGAMILLDDVAKVFDLAHQIARRGWRDRVDRLLAPLLSIAALPGSPFAPMALSKKALRLGHVALRCRLRGRYAEEHCCQQAGLAGQHTLLRNCYLALK